MEVAGHGFDPRIGHPDQRFAQILIGKANGFEHGARRCTITPFRDAATAMLEIHSGRLHYEH
jgi:hypothetical protein